MRHDTARELLALHALGVVEASEAAEVSRHIATCRQCGQEAEIYAFAAAALDAIAGADPAVLHSSDPLPALAGPGLDRIAADVFEQLGSYAPEWPGSVADAPRAAEPAAMWGLTEEDDDTAGDLVRGIANQDSLALQDSAGFADSVTLQDIDRTRVPGLPELSGQSRGAEGWVGPGDPSITSLADEEWPHQEADIPVSGRSTPRNWPQEPTRGEERADEPRRDAPGAWESEGEGEGELHDDWSELATEAAPPAAALLDEATSLRTVISRLKANSGSSDPLAAQQDEFERAAGPPPGEIGPPDESGVEAPPRAASIEQPLVEQGQPAGDGRRGLGALFRRSRRDEPADGTWDDLFQEAEPPATDEPGTTAPMLAGQRIRDPEVLEQPGEISRPPLPPSWLARTGIGPDEGGAPPVEEVESLDSWAQLAGTANQAEAVSAPALPPEPLLDDPIEPEDVDEIPGAGAAMSLQAAAPPVPPAWVAEERSEEEGAAGAEEGTNRYVGDADAAEERTDAPEADIAAFEMASPVVEVEDDEEFEDDWADLFGGEAAVAENEADEPLAPVAVEVPAAEEAVEAVAPIEAEAATEELRAAEAIVAPEEGVEEDEEFEDDWADLLGGEAAVEENEADEPPAPTAVEVPAAEKAVEAVAPIEAPAAAEELRAAEAIVAPEVGVEDDEEFEDDWADLLGGEVAVAENEADEPLLPVAVEIPTAAEAADAVAPIAADEPYLPTQAEVAAVEEAVESVEDAGAAIEAETAPEEVNTAAEILGAVADFDDEEEFEDDWADLLSGETVAPETQSDEPGAPAFAEVVATQEPIHEVADDAYATEVATAASTAEQAALEAMSGGDDAAAKRESLVAPEDELGTAGDDDFADSWAGLALAEDDEQRVADEAFAMAALEEPEQAEEDQAATLFRAQATTQAGNQPIARSGRGRFGFLRRGRKQDEDRPAALAGLETATGPTGAFADGSLPPETDSAEPAVSLPAGTDVETTEEQADEWSALAGDGVDAAEALATEVPSVDVQAPGAPDPMPEVPDTKLPAAEAAPDDRSAAEEPAAELAQALLFDHDGISHVEDEPTVEDLAHDTAASAETGTSSDDEVGAKQRRRFGWLRRAIPGGEDIEDDWAAVAKAGPEVPADDLDAGPPETTTAEVPSEALLELDVEDEEPPPADAAVVVEMAEAAFAEQGPAAEVAEPAEELADTQPEERGLAAEEAEALAEAAVAEQGPAAEVAEPAERLAAMQVEEQRLAAEEIEALAEAAVTEQGPAAEVAEPAEELADTQPEERGLAAEGAEALAEAAAGPGERAMFEPPSVTDVAGTVAAPNVEDEAAEAMEGTLNDLFGESEADDASHDGAGMPSRRRFGWFRSRRREDEDGLEPDEWAAVAAGAAEPADAEADPGEYRDEEIDEEDLAADEQVSPLDDFAAAEADEEERAAALQSESVVDEEADWLEAVEALEPADEEIAPESAAPDVPRSASPPPSRHRLREMMRRRRSARRASDGAEADEPIEAVDQEPEPAQAPPVVPEPEPEPSYLVEELEELTPPDEESGRARRRRGGGPGRRHLPGEREASGAQRGALRRALGRQRDTEGEEDEEAAISPWAEVLRKPERPPSAPMAGAFATPYIPGPVDWGLERYDDDEPETEDEAEVASSSWRFWTVMFGVTTVVLFGLLIGGIVMLVNLRQESQQLEVAKDAAAVPITFSSAVDPDQYSGDGYLERDRGQALLTLKGITGAEQGQQYVIWADNGAGTVSPVAWTTGRSSSTTQYIPLNRVPRDVQRIYITLETFSGRPEAPPLGEILLEAPTP